MSPISRMPRMIFEYGLCILPGNVASTCFHFSLGWRSSKVVLSYVQYPFKQRTALGGSLLGRKFIAWEASEDLSVRHVQMLQKVDLMKMPI